MGMAKLLIFHVLQINNDRETKIDVPQSLNRFNIQCLFKSVSIGLIGLITFLSVASIYIIIAIAFSRGLRM